MITPTDKPAIKPVTAVFDFNKCTVACLGATFDIDNPDTYPTDSSLKFYAGLIKGGALVTIRLAATNSETSKPMTAPINLSYIPPKKKWRICWARPKFTSVFSIDTLKSYTGLDISTFVNSAFFTKVREHAIKYIENVLANQDAILAGPTIKDKDTAKFNLKRISQALPGLKTNTLENRTFVYSNF